MCEGDPDEPQDPSRRGWLKACVAASLGAAAGAASAGLVASLVRSEYDQYETRESVSYPPSPSQNGAWWDPLVNRPMHVTDFGLWAGAPGVWRATYLRGEYVPATGIPVLAVRVPRDDTVFTAPTDVVLPAGTRLYFDDPVRDLRIVLLWIRCTHLCCKVAWHDAPVPGFDHVYTVPAPTWEVFGQDPIWCQCHGAQYDPMVLVKGVHAGGSEEYVGAQVVHGPGTEPLPVLPFRVESDTLVGVMAYPGWYDYCK